MQDTSGIDAHMAPVAIHTVMACYRLWLLAVAHGEDRPAAANGAAPTGKGATPRPEGLVRARGRSCLHTPAPAPGGRSQPGIPCGKAVQHRCELPPISGSVRSPGRDSHRPGSSPSPPSRPSPPAVRPLRHRLSQSRQLRRGRTLRYTDFHFACNAIDGYYALFNRRQRAQESGWTSRLNA